MFYKKWNTKYIFYFEYIILGVKKLIEIINFCIKQHHPFLYRNTSIIEFLFYLETEND